MQYTSSQLPEKGSNSKVKETQPLTERQLGIYTSFLQTKNKHETARQLGVSIETVRYHIANMKNISIDARQSIEIAELESIKPRQARAVIEGGVATSAELYELVQAQEYKCALSGACIKDPNNASLDHKTPISKGGKNNIENLQWLLSEINLMKGSLENDRFVELCCMVADTSRKHLQ